MIKIQHKDFNIENEIDQINSKHSNIGAVSTFVGYVKNINNQQNVTSINLEVYKRYGWKAPIDGYSELEELELRKNFVIKSNIKKKYLDILDRLSLDYENKYLKNFFE